MGGHKDPDKNDENDENNDFDENYKKYFCWNQPRMKEH